MECLSTSGEGVYSSYAFLFCMGPEWIGVIQCCLHWYGPSTLLSSNANDFWKKISAMHLEMFHYLGMSCSHLKLTVTIANFVVIGKVWFYGLCIIYDRQILSIQKVRALESSSQIWVQIWYWASPQNCLRGFWCDLDTRRKQVSCGSSKEKTAGKDWCLSAQDDISPGF